MEPSTTPPPAKSQDFSNVTPTTNGNKSALGTSSEIAQRLEQFTGTKKEGEKPPGANLPLHDRKGKPAEKPAGEKETTPTPGEGEKVGEGKEKEKEKEKVGTDGLTKEERAQVVEFKKRAESAETRIKDLEIKAQAGEASAKELAEVKKWRAEKEPYYERLEKEQAAINVQRSQKYQETIARPMQALTQTIEKIAQSCQLNADEVFAAIANEDLVKRNAAVSQYIADMDPLTQDTFKRAVNDLLDLYPKANKIYTESQEAWQAIQEEEKARAQQDAQKARETYAKASDAVWDEMVKHFPFLDTEEVRGYVREKADSIDFESVTPDIKAYMAQSAYSMAKVADILEGKDEEIKNLKESLKRLSGKSGMNSGSPAPLVEERKSYDGAQTSGARFEQWLQGR